MKDLNTVIEPRLRVVNITKNQLAKRVDMSETGFYKALKRNDVTVSTLEKISKILQVPVGFFFEDNENSALNSNIEQYKVKEDNYQKTIKHLLTTIENISLGKFSPVLFAPLFPLRLKKI